MQGFILYCAAVSVMLAGIGAYLYNNNNNESLNETNVSYSAPYSEEFHNVQPVGEVPEEFKTIVDENLFADVDIQNGSFIRQERSFDDGKYEYTLSHYDIHGNLLGKYSDVFSEQISCLTETSDGGFIFAVGFVDYQNSDGNLHSQDGVVSSIIKCSADGKKQWQKDLKDRYGENLSCCIENDGGYYFFGSFENPETKQPGIFSYTDIYMLKLDKSGNTISEKTYGGSDFEMFYLAEKCRDGFTVYISSQSPDGDYVSSSAPVPENMKVYVDKDLNNQKIESLEALPPEKIIGSIDERPVRIDDKTVIDPSDGYLTAVIDYGSFYLAVSKNITGIDENTPPYISSVWYNYEYVYGAYDKSGKLLCKAVKDGGTHDNISTPYPKIG